MFGSASVVGPNQRPGLPPAAITPTRGNPRHRDLGGRLNLQSKILEVRDSLEQLTGELENFQDIAKYIKPLRGELPSLNGIDLYGDSLPLNGVVGGDHIIYVDFKRRYDLQARIRQAEKAGKEDVVRNLRRCQKMAGIATVCNIIRVNGHTVLL